MPVPIHSSSSAGGSSPPMEVEVAKLRSDLEALRKKKSGGAPAATASAKLPLILAGLALLVSIIALFR